MRNQTLMALVLAGLLLLSGCGLVGTYELKGEKMLTLDQAIGRATTKNDLYASSRRPANSTGPTTKSS